MLFQKSYWVDVTEGIDVISLIHNVRLAVREAQVTEGLLTAYVPDGCGAVVLAPAGLEKDRVLIRWLTQWTEHRPKATDEIPNKRYLSHLFGASLTLPIEKGEMTIDTHADIYILDFTDEKSRREIRISLMSESPKDQEGGACPG